MFDPTAFENMKVVLEGALYDLDLSGDILIKDRNDLMNLSKLSRMFEISFSLPNMEDFPVTAKFSLTSKLENLAAELLTSALSESLAGSYIQLEFILQQEHKIEDYRKIEAILSEIWGSNRKITITNHFDSLTGRFNKTIASIEFARLVREDQLDDLTEMIDVMVMTLNHLQSFSSLG